MNIDSMSNGAREGNIRRFTSAPCFIMFGFLVSKAFSIDDTPDHAVVSASWLDECWLPQDSLAVF